MKTYKIHFIRNGLTDGNLKGRYIGHTDEILAPEGAAHIKHLDETMDYPYCDVVFSSPLKRCLQTAHIIYPDKEPIVLEDLIECNFGEFENQTADDLRDDDDFKAWISGSNETAPPRGESGKHFGMRAIKCFDSIVEGLIKTGVTDAVIVTHGGVIMTILSAFGVPETGMTYWQTEAGHGFSMTITPQIWSQMKKGEVMGTVPSKKRGEDDGYDDVFGYNDSFEDDGN